jgi:glutathione S-transferase
VLAVESDPDFLAINPAGFIPALQDGETNLAAAVRASISVAAVPLATVSPSLTTFHQ